MSVYFEHDQQTIIVRGKTYPYRDLMRSLGGQYQAVEKTWAVPMSQENLQKVSELCLSIGGGRRREEAAAAKPGRGPEASPPTESAPAPPLVGGVLDGLSIGELMQKAQLAIAHGFPRSVWVLGEIQNLRSHASGLFFQLADFKEGASRSATLTINATLWRSQLLELERRLGPGTVKDLIQDGIRVRVLADVSLYKDRGQLSLLVQGLDPNFTKGSLALAREKLLRELRSKGLDRQNKQLTPPAFPLRIGLISAPDSRAQSDFLDQLRVYGFPGEVIFFPAQMQGEKTLSDVVAGLTSLTAAACDLIVLTRGGGSAADLRWFDSPEIAYAIAGSSIPVVAAIGHHEDVCIAEEICFQREKTPTAAADFVINLFARTRERIDQLSLSLSQQLGERIRLQSLRLQNLRERLLLGLRGVLGSYQQHQTQLENGLDIGVQRQLLREEGRLTQIAASLRQISRLRLERGQSQAEQASSRLGYRFQEALSRAHYKLAQTQQALKSGTQRAAFNFDRSLDALERAIVQRDPQPWMAEGWTQLSSEGESRILSARNLGEGQELKARLPDALLTLRIEEVKRLSPSQDLKD